ncbi:lysozyme inhibitor LprI family protein [Lentibacillus salicampi]|uniref:DUF1311 domain-containing protein n=1 Tax=Lentibacillus salicampi TaxID=175306 RepID=A0A4Y9AEY5_9BACI|nr:lysozyme inhibitor LprI family protein [Lentibacillus salicampi]TFJ92924.1 DUF1311 domain-containing protein [Lentibacillus salicampi]
MKNNRQLLIIMLTVIFVILAACDNSSEESNVKADSASTDSSPTQNADDGASNKTSTETDNNKTENSQEDTYDNQSNDLKDTSENASANTNEGKSSAPSDGNSEVTENRKEDYLQKLNEMEEADRNAESKTTIPDMEEQEEERYKKWDVELNKIYAVLKEQLSADQMNDLKEEQRDWVEHRDEAAKEASLEYEGGSTESLEYVATQASLTRERCYALVAKYMK